jgi:hypothetical protein
MKLLRLIDSPKPDKKYRAVFETDAGRQKNVDFGAKGMEDYTQHHDKERRERYRARHAKDLKTGDATRAGYLSYYILWGDSTSIRANTEAYKKKFNL